MNFVYNWNPWIIITEIRPAAGESIKLTQWEKDENFLFPVLLMVGGKLDGEDDLRYHKIPILVQ